MGGLLYAVIISIVVFGYYEYYNYRSKKRRESFIQKLRRGKVDVEELRSDLSVNYLKIALPRQNWISAKEKLSLLIDKILLLKFLIKDVESITLNEILICAEFNYNEDFSGIPLLGKPKKIEDYYFLLRFNEKNNLLTISSTIFDSAESKNDLSSFAKIIFDFLKPGSYSVKYYYRVLELSANSSQREIVANYRMLAKRFHPDVNKAADAKEKFQTLQEAYSILSNPEKRKKYDEGKFF